MQETGATTATSAPAGPPTTGRGRPLRRMREAVCLVVAAALFVGTWAAGDGAFSGTRGHRTLLVLLAVEAVTLTGLFVLEAVRPRRGAHRRWITLAWWCLPAWAAVDLVAGAILRATG